MKNVLFLLILLSLLSCRSRENKYSNLAIIKDERLKTALKKYVEDENINIKSHFISVECTYQLNKIIYKISAGKSSQGYKLSPPDYFTVVDDILILLRVTNNETVKLTGIDVEIDNLIEENKISLEKEIKYFDPPVWTLINCSGNYELSTKMNPDIQEVLPCGYSIKTNMGYDSVTLIKHSEGNNQKF